MPGCQSRPCSVHSRTAHRSSQNLCGYWRCFHDPTPRGRESRRSASRALAQAQDPLLLRVARGEDAERVPVWLMRQAGRYMPEFREFSNQYGFRHRSETADIAIELSLQPWRAFQPDGVIMFSDILTPLPALGIEFDVVPKKGPIIQQAIRSMDQIQELRPLDDPGQSLPFIHTILQALCQEVGSASTVLGFVGSPWTLAAYAVEGKADKHCMKTKTMMLHNPKMLHALLRHLTDALVRYVCHQIDSGAQVVQIFDSWAHHLSPAQFQEFSLPYAEEIVQRVHAQRPSTPLIFHANGGMPCLSALQLKSLITLRYRSHACVLSPDCTGYSGCVIDGTGKLSQIGQHCSADVLGVDWHASMADARHTLGGSRVLQGNVDPMILMGPQAEIEAAVSECLAGGAGDGALHHILNVGHGVAQGTPPDNVAYFCELARRSSKSSSKLAEHRPMQPA